ncbi:hypothetical protein M595_3525 [Lyngbya aestuarii BL J]|uniref:Uncharacterized protein n=1 Tax=Lyngbya aestuarii BL J TaxID=1348334 RepID=U7QF36_9CYAN|nr:hypothetical protein M595_3525 [Lyngbya aestuarii BL J]
MICSNQTRLVSHPKTGKKPETTSRDAVGAFPMSASWKDAF